MSYVQEPNFLQCSLQIYLDYRVFVFQENEEKYEKMIESVFMYIYPELA